MVTPHPEYQRFSEYWSRLDDWCAEDAVKNSERVESYLPRLAAMLPSQSKNAEQYYRWYVEHGMWFGGIPRAVSILTGGVFRKDPTAELGALGYLAEDATGSGMGLRAVAELIMRKLALHSRVAVLVDHKAGADGALGEPRLSVYDAASLVEWDGPASDPTTVVFKEQTGGLKINDGTVFSIERSPTKTRHRVVTMQGGKCIAIELEDGEKVGETKVIGRNGVAPFLPVTIINASDLGTRPSVPALEPLLRAQIQLLRATALYCRGCMFGVSPVVYTSGPTAKKGDGPRLVAGSMESVSLPPNTTLSIAEYQGHVLPHVWRLAEFAMEQVQAFGYQFFGSEMPNTATASKLLEGGDINQASAIAQNCSRGIERALGHCHRLGNFTGAPPVYQLNRDLANDRPDPQLMDALLNQWISGAMSYRSLFAALRAMEAPMAAESAEKEMEQIKAEKAAGLIEQVRAAEARYINDFDGVDHDAT